MPKMRPREEYDRASALLRGGASIDAVARATGVPRSTVGYWRRTRGVRRGGSAPTSWSLLDPRAYCYLLGLYLGDGTVMQFRPGTSYCLRLFLDAKYEGIIAEATAAIAAVVPQVTVRRYDHAQGVAILHASCSQWPAVLPQHGPGKKHLRPIVLEPWQRQLTARYPQALLRGLIHSDGARCVNRFSTKLPSGRVADYEYPRYFFTNYSADIRGIFCGHCELLGIRWTRSSFKNISVSHRDSVAILDEFVGPKR